MSKERNKLIKKLDDIFSLYIRERDKYRCFTCGRKISEYTVMQAGHLFSRVSHSTRWDEKNCHAQCQPCNWYHEEHAERYTFAFIKKYGQQEYEKLYAKYCQTTKFTDSDLKYLIQYYKDKLKQLKAA